MNCSSPLLVPTSSCSQCWAECRDLFSPHLKMSFRSMVRDLRGSFGSISKRNFEVRIHHRGKSLGSSSDMQEEPVVIHQSRWASLPPELLRDVMKRLEEDENSWPSRKDVVACASVCQTWRDTCKDIVATPEFCAKLTFPVSLKQPGPRDGMIQCFIKRDRSKRTYRLYLCLTSAVPDENGKFLLAAKRSRRTSHTDYAISMDSRNISRSSSGYIGKLRSNFLGTKFVVYDTQAPYNAGRPCSRERASRRFSSRKVSPRVPARVMYPVADVNYELNVLGTRGPRRMQCSMHSIPASAVEPDGIVPGQPKELLPKLFEESYSFRSSTGTSFSKYSVADSWMDVSSCHLSSEFSGGTLDYGGDAERESPLVLRNKVPRWHEQLQCWCLNFRGRVTVASVKNFQLIACCAQAQASSSSSSSHDAVILQFGKVAKDTFTMDYRYPLSAFQAFAICLTSFDTKLACE